jgi:beta-N-acetylhexosaminidase
MRQAYRAFEARNVLLLTLVIYLLVGCGASGERHSANGKNQDSSGDRANIVSGMSVRDMVGQMFVVSVGGTRPDYYIEKMVRKRNIGGVILFAYNMKSEEQVESLIGSLQQLSMQTEPAVPLFVGVDQEGGDIASAPWVAPQPAAAEVGSRGDPSEAHDIAATMGRQLLRAGVNTDFAPVVDTGFGAAIGNRSYGEDPELVARMGAAAVEGFEEVGVVSAAKHFPNHGPATTDSHVNLPVIRHDAKTLQSYDLPPFEAAVEAGVPMVMVGHLLYPAIDPHNPASLSRDATGMLRSDLGFDGVIVTDDLAMAGAKGGGTPAEAAVQAVQAGADLLIVSSRPQQQADAYDAVVDAVESGEIPRSRIAKSVGRLLTVKERYHLGGVGRH